MIVDISVKVTNSTPVWPGDAPVDIKADSVIAKDGVNDSIITIGTHNGTHIDAPAHMIEGGKTLDQIPIECFVGRGVYIEVVNLQFDINIVKNADIQSGDIVLFHTGMSNLFDQPEQYFNDYPDIPEEIVNYLIDKNINMVGFDMCSLDHPDYRMHKLFLGSDICIIENLTNLVALKGKKYTVTALPLNLELDGSPARVIAEVTS